MGTGPGAGVAAHALRVTRKDVLSDGVVRVRLERPEGGRLPDWSPGAHVDLVLPLSGGSEDDLLVRNYSLCGNRWEADAYEVAILREPESRGGSRYIHDELSVGDLIDVSTPRNNFDLWPATKYLFIAGGIGITPIMTMIDSAERLGVDWELLYGGRSLASMAFKEELAQYGDRVTLWPQDEKGLLDLSYLDQPITDAKVYCCGPEPLLDAVRDATTNWPSWAVRFERFVPKTQHPPARSEPFTVVLARSGVSVEVTNDETILDALSQAGRSVVASCREGLCGTCDVKVLDGIPDHRDSLLTDDERDKGDRMFVCVSRSVTDTITLDL